MGRKKERVERSGGGGGDPEMAAFCVCQKQVLFISSIPQEPAG